jgi:DNA-binding response OmpR family regulator
VLLVDGNHHHQIPLIAALRKAGYWVLHAAGGATAEAISRTLQHPIHVLVAREEIKRMSGADLARRLTRQRPDIRALLMRRHSKGVETEGADPAPTVEQPESAVIEDPFAPAEFCSRVSELLASTHYRNEDAVRVIA